MTTTINVLLEHIVSKSGLEPVSIVVKIPVDHYTVGQPGDVLGQSVLGVRIKEDGGEPIYIVERSTQAVAAESDDLDMEVSTQAIFRVQWTDTVDPENPLTASYLAVREDVDGAAAFEPDQEWVFLLKQTLTPGGQRINHLVYRLSVVGAGPVDPITAKLEQNDINCANTGSKLGKLLCKILNR